MSTVLLAACAWAQTNPTARSIPFTEDFGTTTFTSPPSGFISWNGLNGNTISTQALAEGSSPSGNATIAAQTAATTTGGTHGLANGGNARFYVQTSGNATNGVNQIAMAINTEGYEDVEVGYDVEIISVGGASRTIGVVCQYRVGTSGGWTTISPVSGDNPYAQTGGTTGVKTTVSATLPSACDDQPVVQVRWAIWRAGTGNSSGLAIDNVVTDGTLIPVGTNTSVQFAITGTTVSEGVGTYDVAVSIANFSTTQATSVDVALVTGNGTRINGFSDQTVTFPANSGTTQNVTITVTDNGICDGDAELTLGLENLSGGQGTPFIGTNSTFELTVTDNEATTDPVATAATSIGATEFTANWNAVGGATNYYLDVYTNMPGGLLAEWNFPTDGTDLTVDDGSPANLTRSLSAVGTNILTDVDGYTTKAPNYTGWNNGDGTKYWIVDFSTEGFGGITVSSRQRGSNTGPREFKVQYRVGTLGAWTDVAGGAVTVANNWTSGVVADLALPAECNDQEQVFVRWIMTSNTSINNGTVAAGGTSRIDDIVINATGGVSFVPGYENFDAGTATSEVVSGLAIGETYYYVVRASGGCASAETSNEIEVTTVPVANYYSRGSGSVNDAIWSDSPTGTAGAAAWTSASSMTVQAGDAIDVDDDIAINDLTVEASAQLDLAANTLTISGETVEIAGGLTAVDGSAIVLNNPDGVILESAGALDLFDLTANTPGGVLTDAAISIRGTLLLLDGEFDASLGSVTLASDASGTGRLGPVGAGASYTGDMTVQRYIPAGATNWRFLGSPVAGQTVNDWKDDFYTAGFPGSHSPGFSNPVGSGILWPSIRWYDETLAYAHIDTGWVGVSSIAQELETAQGFAAWCGTGLTTTTAFTIDVTGEPHIAQSPITRDLDRTNNGAPTVDGWNAVSNPLPSPVLFSNLARTNVEDYVYIFNPAVGNVAVFDISSQQSINNGTDTIQSSQAFLVQATGSGASIAFEEADKVNDRQGGFFGGAQRSLFDGVRLKLTSGVNTFSDETVVSFGAGEAGVDVDDVPKMTFAHPDAPQIATVVDGSLFAINAAGMNDADVEIPVKVDVSLSGTYTVTATGLENIGLTCLLLEDLETGIITPLVEGATYSFAMEAGASAEPRLLLRASARVPLYAEGITCHGMADGQGTVVNPGMGTMDITWTNNAGEVLLEQRIEDGVAIFSTLAAGTYGVSVSGDTGCGAVSTTFTIEEPAALEVAALHTDATCPSTADGRVDLTVLGGTAPYTFAWSDGSSAEDLVAAAGSYTVTISDANGCAMGTPEFFIGAGAGPVASAGMSTTTVLVNEPVSFTNNGTEAYSHVWEFGDGQFSIEPAPAHSWSAPGTYTVTLLVDDGNCSDTWTAQVMVEAPTSTAGTNAAQALSAWFANDRFMVEHGFSNGLPVVVDVLDATGRLHITRQFAGTPARVQIPADGLSTGIWFVRIQNDGSTRTVRVPVVR